MYMIYDNYVRYVLHRHRDSVICQPHVSTKYLYDYTEIDYISICYLGFINMRVTLY